MFFSPCYHQQLLQAESAETVSRLCCSNGAERATGKAALFSCVRAPATLARCPKWQFSFRWYLRPVKPAPACFFCHADGVDGLL